MHNFWFEVERKLKIRDPNNTEIDPNNTEMDPNNAEIVPNNTEIEKIKEKFLEEVNDKKANYFSRFLFVREYLTKKKIQEIK